MTKAYNFDDHSAPGCMMDNSYIYFCNKCNFIQVSIEFFIAYCREYAITFY